MSLLDDYQNIDEEADEDVSAADPDAKRRKRADLERQIVILNSDLGKTVREIEDLDIEKRKLKKQGERLRIDQDELEKKLKKMENDRMLLEEQIRGTKKKLKTLT